MSNGTIASLSVLFLIYASPWIVCGVAHEIRELFTKDQ